ncbi:hypothetical protein GGR30_004633 [Martelella radicis]|uniref:Mutator family transposase n=1 Tax=Martelella radicis TaxID=1397476 RepID=A0A7W6KRI9_9HYPH|nr:hypothetical protein [Martelella radicis]
MHTENLGAVHISSVVVIIAIGVNTDGRREVLGLEIGTSEAAPIWTEFLRNLTIRGLRLAYIEPLKDFRHWIASFRDLTNGIDLIVVARLQFAGLSRCLNAQADKTVSKSCPRNQHCFVKHKSPREIREGFLLQ